MDFYWAPIGHLGNSDGVLTTKFVERCNEAQGKAKYNHPKEDDLI